MTKYAVTLTFDVSTKWWFQTDPVYINALITTKLFNDSLPSHTLRMRRGAQYQVTG